MRSIFSLTNYLCERHTVKAKIIDKLKADVSPQLLSGVYMLVCGEVGLEAHQKGEEISYRKR